MVPAQTYNLLIMKLADSQIIQKLNEIYDAVASGGGAGAVWGAITGTLADQTDLNTALGTKQTEAQVQTIADAKVSDTAYDATSWNGVTGVAPSKNAVRDKIEAVVASIPPAHSGGVIGTVKVLISGAVSFQHGFGVLAAGTTGFYGGVGIYTITPIGVLPGDGRDYIVNFTQIDGAQVFGVKIDNSATTFDIHLVDATDTPIDPTSFMLSVQTLSQ